HALDLQSGKLVGDHAQLPSRSVGWGTIPAIGQDFGRREVLVPGTKGAPLGSEHRRTLQTEVARTLAALGRNDYPAVGDGVFAKLRQVRTESLKGKRQECKGKVENEKLQRRVEGVLVHIDHGTIPVELNRHDVEPAGTISEAVTRQVVSRER